MKPVEKLEARIKKANSLLCVGPDPDFFKLPKRFLAQKYPQFEFSKWIVDRVHDSICAFKPNLAFYEARGDQGIQELKMTMEYVQQTYPDIFTIGDAKRADIGSTNEGYVGLLYDWLGFDAITVHPYLGKEALRPFLERDDKVAIILCRTSNPGAPEFQDIENKEGRKVWEIVAKNVAHDWNEHGNCMLVVGATYPKELARVREIVGDMTLLVPGIGAQGGSVEESVKAGKTVGGKGMIINSSRGIIFNPDPAREAEKLKLEINTYR